MAPRSPRCESSSTMRSACLSAPAIPRPTQRPRSPADGPPDPEPPAAAAEDASIVDQPTEFYDYESEMSEGEGRSEQPRPSESLGAAPGEEPDQDEPASAARPDDDLLSEQSLSD